MQNSEAFSIYLTVSYNSLSSTASAFVAAFSASSSAKTFSDSISLGPTATDVKYRIFSQMKVDF